MRGPVFWRARGAWSARACDSRAAVEEKGRFDRIVVQRFQKRCATVRSNRPSAAAAVRKSYARHARAGFLARAMSARACDLPAVAR
eukprot:5051427-Lingulodinium_polyedra.AAC.1